MSTLNTDIYILSVKQFDDPFVQRQYNGSMIALYSDLYGYLTVAIPEFTRPSGITKKISEIVIPSGETETFDGDGNTVAFNITVIPIANSIIEVSVDSVVLQSTEYTFDTETNVLTFANAPTAGTDNVQFSWYFPGEFSADLNTYEKNILSDLLIYKWTLKEKNHLPDIRRLLRDTDYQLYSESTSISAKIDLTDVAREKADKGMKDYGWSIYLDDLNQRYGLKSYTDGRL